MRASIPLHTAMACLLAVASLLPTLANASEKNDFCKSSPGDMLSVIEGQWSLKQGAGGGLGAVIPFPLPAHPPQSVRITVDETRGIATLKQAGQQMAIIPVAADEVKDSTGFLTQADVEGLIDTSGGCDWSALPLMLGSNTYSLDAVSDVPDLVVVRVLSRTTKGHLVGVNHAFCGTSYSHSQTDQSIAGPDEDPVSVGTAERSLSKELCKRRDLPEPTTGEMVMNLLVKFHGPDKGTGILLFHGQMNGYEFAARAPVTLTR